MMYIQGTQLRSAVCAFPLSSPLVLRAKIVCTGVKMIAVREEMWAQAARDRDALQAEMNARHEGERERLLEEARERAIAMVEEVIP